MVDGLSDEELDAIGVLREPVRRSLYRFVVSQRKEVSRNEAAEAVGVRRTLAAFHLDKLVDAGLLETSYRRLGGRTGPGAGRPSKLYRRDARARPIGQPRSYGLVAALLTKVVDESGGDLALQAAARRHGLRVAGKEPATAPDTDEREGEAARGAAEVDGPDAVEKGPGDRDEEVVIELRMVLERHGFEPYRDGRRLLAQNCPFRELSDEYPALVCGMNLALLDGIVTAMSTPDIGENDERPTYIAVMDPAPGRCCVALVPSDRV